MNATDTLQTLKPTEMDAGLVFSGHPNGTRVSGYEKPSPFTQLKSLPSISGSACFSGQDRHCQSPEIGRVNGQIRKPALFGKPLQAISL